MYVWMWLARNSHYGTDEVEHLANCVTHFSPVLLTKLPKIGEPGIAFFL